jgi:hypothetical protein
MLNSRKPPITSLEIYRLYLRKTICKDGWTDSFVIYGKRLITAETVFSSTKRTFGEHIYSVRLKNMIKEMMLKASLYNKFTSL